MVQDWEREIDGERGRHHHVYGEEQSGDPGECDGNPECVVNGGDGTDCCYSIELKPDNSNIAEVADDLMFRALYDIGRTANGMGKCKKGCDQNCGCCTTDGGTTLEQEHTKESETGPAGGVRESDRERLTRATGLIVQLHNLVHLGKFEASGADAEKIATVLRDARAFCEETNK